MLRKMLALLAASILVSGCSTIAPNSTPTNVSWQNRSHNLANLQNWTLEGKIGVQTARDSGSANIDWTQRGQHFAISLTGPLGSNGMTLNGQPGAVSMTTSDGKHASASSPEQLLKQQWGWNLPVSNLKYWVLGLPVPGIPASTQFDAYHRLASLSQQGWQVDYLGYTNAGGLELPNRISITSAAVRAKLVVYDWQASS